MEQPRVVFPSLADRINKPKEFSIRVEESEEDGKAQFHNILEQCVPKCTVHIM